jgi:translation initiation factor IF-3
MLARGDLTLALFSSQNAKSAPRAGRGKLSTVNYQLSIVKRRRNTISSLSHQINREIRDREVRLIGEEGEQLGVMPVREAMDIAIERNLDLVKISPGANPPVCKLMDYGKFRFEQTKRDKETKKNQKIVEIKEIRMTPGIGQHDFDTKLKAARGFLDGGDKVKVAVRFRGREMTHTDIGAELLKKFAAALEDIATVNKDAKLDGRHMAMFMAPKAAPAVKAAPAPVVPAGPTVVATALAEATKAENKLQISNIR